MDPFATEHRDDPYPLYRELRAAGVVHVPDRDLWVVARFADARAVLRRPAEFVSGLGTAYRRVADSGFRGPLIDNDPPDHTRVRRSVQRWFTPSSLEAVRPAMRALADRAVGDVLDAGDVDLVEAIARPFPVLALGELLGLDHPDPLQASGWMDSIFHLLGPDPADEHLARAMELFAWGVTEAGARVRPESLAASILDGDDPAEALGLLLSIWSAGIDTTTNLISTAFHTMSQTSAVLDGETAAVTEELLRHRSPAKVFLRRTAAATSVGGVDLPADADIAVLFASANRDDAHFPDPDRFDPDRAPLDHVAFGSGIHLCLGAPLLRLEMTELLGALRSRVGSVELADVPVVNPSHVIQGYSVLRARLVPA